MRPGPDDPQRFWRGIAMAWLFVGVAAFIVFLIVRVK